MRVHGNFAEYVPLAMILIMLAELGGASNRTLDALGLALLLGRAVHAFGVSQPRENHRFRVDLRRCSALVIRAPRSVVVWSDRRGGVETRENDDGWRPCCSAQGSQTPTDRGSVSRVCSRRGRERSGPRASGGSARSLGRVLVDLRAHSDGGCEIDFGSRSLTMLLSYAVATTAFAKGLAIGGAVAWVAMRACRRRSG